MVSRFSLLNEDNTVILSKNTFNNTVVRTIIHFMDLPVRKFYVGKYPKNAIKSKGFP